MTSIRNEKLTRDKILSLRDQYRSSFLSDETKEYVVTAFELRPLDEKQKTPECEEMLYVNYKSPQEKDYFFKLFLKIHEWLLTRERFESWHDPKPTKYIIDNAETNELIFKMPKDWLLYESIGHYGSATWRGLDDMLKKVDQALIASPQSIEARRTKIQNELKDPHHVARRKTREIKRVELLGSSYVIHRIGDSMEGKDISERTVTDKPGLLAREIGQIPDQDNALFQKIASYFKTRTQESLSDPTAISEREVELAALLALMQHLSHGTKIRKVIDISDQIEVQQALKSGKARDFFAEAASKKTLREILEEDIRIDFSSVAGIQFIISRDAKQEGTVNLSFDKKSDPETHKYLFHILSYIADHLNVYFKINKLEEDILVYSNKMTIPAQLAEKELTQSQVASLYTTLMEIESRVLKRAEVFAQDNKRTLRQVNKKMAGLIKIRQENGVTYLDYKNHESMPVLRDFKHQSNGSPTLISGVSTSFVTSLLDQNMSKFETKENPGLQALIRDLDAEITQRNNRDLFHTFWGWVSQLFVGEAYSTPVKRAALTHLLAQLSAGKVINEAKDVSADANIQIALQQGVTNSFFKRACVASRPVVQTSELKAGASQFNVG